MSNLADQSMYGFHWPPFVLFLHPHTKKNKQKKNEPAHEDGPFDFVRRVTSSRFFFVFPRGFHHIFFRCEGDCFVDPLIELG